jgi:Tol biopolymer transport system component
VNKKAIAILGAIFLLIVGTLGFLIFSKSKSNKTATQPPVVDNNQASSTPSTSSTTPVQNSSPFVKVSDDQIISPALFFNGNGVTYFDSSGSLYQQDFDTSSGQLQLKNRRKLEVEARPNLVKVLWPSKGDNFIAEFRDPQGNISYSFYNSGTRSYTDLPRQVTALDWTPAGDKIIFIWTDGGKSTINIANPDTSNYQYIADMWQTDNAISVSPNGTSILYYETANPGTANKITLTTPDGKVWKDLASTGYNFGVLWSPDGQKFLFGKKDPVTGNYQLWYYGLSSGEVKNLGLFTTVDKALWGPDGATIYAAVPSGGAAGSGALTSDSFFKLNVSTQTSHQYSPDSSQSIDGRNLFLSQDSNKLFFKNAQDGGLYYLDLTK